ncbi:MAG: tRNA1(Val) (adenine(37)-N6)-methyltransferase [Eubacterium sp.]|nr:tRNA1(Val) (adenine(37)-N6)-methyltransferase [Candidatus Colimonas fimequi]
MALRTDEIGFGDLKLIQNPEEFCYGVDAVLLADFATNKQIKFKSALDMGCGNGIIPLILSYKNPRARITGIDVIETNVSMASDSVKLNNLQDRIEIKHMDVLNVPDEMERESVELVTCNPPYFPKGGGIINGNVAKFTARQETTAELEDFVKAAAFVLKDKGHFVMIHRPSRLADIMHFCRLYRLEPKEMRMICPRAGKAANMVLIHAIKGAGKELKILPDLNIHDSGNGYTSELLKAYEK